MYIVLGVCSTNLVAGAPPYTGSTQEELFGKHLKIAVPSLEAVDGNVTADFANLVRRCLSKDAAGRPASVQEVLEEFRKMRMSGFSRVVSRHRSHPENCRCIEYDML